MLGSSMQTRPQPYLTETKGTVEDWATESLLVARQDYKLPKNGKLLKAD
jgi:hypothetical protein